MSYADDTLCSFTLNDGDYAFYVAACGEHVTYVMSDTSKDLSLRISSRFAESRTCDVGALFCGYVQSDLVKSAR